LREKKTTTTIICFVNVKTDLKLQYIMKDHIPTTFQGRRKPSSKQISRMRAKTEEGTKQFIVIPNGRIGG
jgi:hypothetical protein